MANGDKDDKKKKKKQPAGGKNVRVLRPQGSGAIKPLEEVVTDTGKAIGAAGKATGEFFGDVGKAVVESTQPSIPVKAPEVDFKYEDKKEGEKIEGVDAPGFTASGRRRTEESDKEDFTPKAKFFGSMGKSETGSFSPDKKEAARLAAFGPPQEREQSFSPDRQEEARLKAFGTTEADITAFDSDGNGRLNASERSDMKAFNRENLLTSFRERQERAEAQLAEINARTPTIDSDATRAAMQAAAPAKTKEDGGPKFGALGSIAQYFTELGRKGKSAPLSKNLVTSGLRRKDFASDEGFLAAVKNKNSSSQRLGAGSSLRKTPRELGSFSGAMNRAGRRLLRKGASGEAQKMFGAAERQRLTEGSNISTPERRAREEAERRQGAQLMADMQKMMEDYKKMRSNIGIAGSPDSNIQQSSRNTYGSRL
tara:strand:- start:3763 stop:5037 length:1275 start_codon:yes stop_codon:yes gene_type:complete